MQVLFLTHRLPYAPNRGDRLRAWHILALLKRRHEVTVVSLAHDEDEAAHAGDLRDMACEVVVARTPWWANRLRAGVALAGRRPLTHALLSAPEVPPALLRVIQRTPPDVVLAYCSSMARYGLEPPLAGLPLVIDMVDADSAKWAALAETSRPPLSWVYGREAGCLGRFEALAMRHAHATLVVNDREREALVGVLERYRAETDEGPSRHEPNVIVVPNGIAVTDFAPTGPPAEHPSVVFCGVMDYAPNAAGAVWLAGDVWPAVRQRYPQARLWLVGARPTSTVRSLQSDEQGVFVTGAVEDVRPHLWNAAVSAAPLHIARGVQNKVLEAVAAGLPTVVTQAVWEGLPACVQPACRVADDARAFTEAINVLLAMTPEARRAVAQAADLSTLSWEACLAPLEGILEEAAREGRPDGVPIRRV